MFWFQAGSGGSEWPDRGQAPDRTDDKLEMFAAGLNNPSACSFYVHACSNGPKGVYLITKQQLGGGRRSSYCVLVYLYRKEDAMSYHQLAIGY